MSSIFFSYSHKDEELRDQLETHLAMLRNQGLIDSWHDRRILAGDDFDHAINSQINTADVILLLVSPDFLASRYCYDVEVRRAMERQQAGEARVIPVILRHCDWHSAPFGKLLAAPKDGKPIKAWGDPDEAFADVARQIRAALPKRLDPRTRREEATSQSTEIARPRSSNLRIRKEITEADRDRFLHNSFEFMMEFFDSSLAELANRHQEIETAYRRIDNDRFSAVIYQNGKAVSRCKIALGSMFGRGISFSYNDQAADGSMNESLSVEMNDDRLYLKALGIASRRLDERLLTPEGAAEYYWSLLIEPLQR
ncbi:toll/interleukin-1 receptor domain-containing protein [Rhodopseudomonas sp.]|uniref:toll/interleukin-1 receptor domain-containing protein n=1 Tax=Rhodopseudomonas sp. TaxID=1078 RepID=UPI0039E3DB6D